MAKNRLGSATLVGLVGFVALAATAAGCGDDGNSLSEFTGTWSYTASMGTLTCPGAAAATGTLGSTIQLAEGVTSALVDLSPSFFDGFTMCYFTFDVRGKVATAQAGQTCVFLDQLGGPHPDTPTSWTFTLLSATTAEVKITSTVDTTCTLIGSGTLKKIAKN